jgi:microcystin degradation protein MlrC
LKTYRIEGLTTQEAELLDVALSVAAANPGGHTNGQAYRDLQSKIESQFEEQDG